MVVQEKISINERKKLRICFWNTNKNVKINNYISDIIEENIVDIFVLAEYEANIDELKKKVKLHNIVIEQAITIGCDRITILKNGKDIKPGFQNKYCSMQIIDNEYLLACLHLPSKLYADKVKRGIAISRIVEDLQTYEENLGIEKTIIVGDINENPYEIGCLGAIGFHGIPVYKDTMKKYRTIMEESFKMFYNPTWNLLGDFSFPPGTYYYSGNEVENSFWNVYDQVMIRPCLREQFVDDELKILYETKSGKLIDTNNRPDKSISNHLPIIFEIMEG